ncbi:MAG: cytochrome P450 [Candidatus Binataceae bacterium]
MDVDHALTDPGFFVTGDPHSVWLQLRREDPVHWTVGRLTRGFWSVTRYADVLAVYDDPRTFSSEQGVHLPSSPQMESITPAQQGCGEALFVTDPPLHGTMRRALNRVFLPHAVARFESNGPKLVEDILLEVLPRGKCDFVSDIAAKIPMSFICQIMGVPREDRSAIYTWANMALSYEDPEYQVGSAVETRYLGAKKIFQYCVRLALERRGGGGDDLISVLGNAEVGGRALTARELGHNGLMFVVGGLETTRNAISGGLLALIKHPDQMDLLTSDSALMTTAIEEILRWTSPVTQMMRTVSEDTQIGGKKLCRGDRVVVWNASANRDEEVFDNPYSFDISRTPNEHLAFGKGEHFCMGAHLARLELRLTLNALLKHMPEIELAGKVERLRSNFQAGVKHMPVRFTAPTATA